MDQDLMALKTQDPGQWSACGCSPSPPARGATGRQPRRHWLPWVPVLRPSGLGGSRPSSRTGECAGLASPTRLPTFNCP